MKTSQYAKAIGFGLGTSVAAVAVGWAGYAAIEWLEYGHAKSIASRQRDDLLDRFMPAYEIWEQHRVAVDATPAVVFAAAKESNLTDSAIVRAMFKGRELVIGRAPTSNKPLPSGVVEMATSIGWTVLAEIPGREIVFGAATRPWESDAVFRGIAPDAFAAFDEPGYVKIAWTLCADPTGSSTSMFRTDTRVVTTGEEVRAKFRRYWAAFSPGIRLIRRVMLGVVKSSAEARVRRASDLAAMAGQAGPAAASDIPAEW